MNGKLHDDDFVDGYLAALDTVGGWAHAMIVDIRVKDKTTYTDIDGNEVVGLSKEFVDGVEAALVAVGKRLIREADEMTGGAE